MTEEGKMFVLDAYDYKVASVDKTKTDGYVSETMILGKFLFLSSFLYFFFEQVILLNENINVNAWW